MITKNKYYLFFLIGLILFSTDIYSQKTKEPVNRILFVFDAYQSMLGRWQSGRKIDIAKQLLTNITDSLKEVKNLEIALRVYGHQRSYPPQDCDDTKLEINFLPSEIFTDRIIYYLNQQKINIVFFLWGQKSISKKNLIDDKKHLVLTSPHPSPLSAYRGFFGNKHFSTCNKYLIENKRKPIDWLID